MGKLRVRFIKNADYPQVDPAQSRKYVAGQEYDLEEDHARRWLRRQAAVLVEKPVAVVEERAAGAETPSSKPAPRGK